MSQFPGGFGGFPGGFPGGSPGGFPGGLPFPPPSPFSPVKKLFTVIGVCVTVYYLGEYMLYMALFGASLVALRRLYVSILRKMGREPEPLVPRLLNMLATRSLSKAAQGHHPNHPLFNPLAAVMARVLQNSINSPEFLQIPMRAHSMAVDMLHSHPDVESYLGADVMAHDPETMEAVSTSTSTANARGYTSVDEVPLRAKIIFPVGGSRDNGVAEVTFQLIEDEADRQPRTRRDEEPEDAGEVMIEEFIIRLSSGREWDVMDGVVVTGSGRHSSEKSSSGGRSSGSKPEVIDVDYEVKDRRKF